jgi:VanZ family protein
MKRRPSMATMERTLGPLCIVICVGILVAGLRHFESFPNRVSWLEGRNGLAFHGDSLEFGHSQGGIARSPGRLGGKNGPSAEKGAVSIEIRLRPYEELDWGRFHILDLYDESKNALFLVGQRKSDLLIRLRKKDKNGGQVWKDIGVDHALKKGRTAFVTITSGQRGIGVYLDGRLAERFQDVRLLSESQSLSAQRVRIGNSPDGDCAWSGEIFGLSFYDRVLSDDEIAENYQWWSGESSSIGLAQNGLVGAYTFEEGRGDETRAVRGFAPPLSIPARLHFEKSLLAMPAFENESRLTLLKDGVANVVGFAPLGFFLSLWLVRVRRWSPGRAFLLTVFAGMMISLFIESVQVLLPKRDSTFLDLCCNTIGAGLGVSAFHFHRLMQRKGLARSKLRGQSQQLKGRS